MDILKKRWNLIGISELLYSYIFIFIATLLYTVFLQIIFSDSFDNIRLRIDFFSILFLSIFILFIILVSRYFNAKLFQFFYGWVRNRFIAFIISICLILLMTTGLTFLFLLLVNDQFLKDYRRFREFLVIINFEIIIIGSFLLYYYFRDFQLTGLKLSEAEKSALSYKLATLQQQFDPHFLFNNLNILSAYIEPTNEKALNHLSKFSKLYQHLVDVQKEDAIQLKQELEYTGLYIDLLEARFPKLYQFDFQIENLDGFIVPGALQIGIENIIKHNKSYPEEPLKATIVREQDALIITNQILPKSSMIQSNKTGLTSLQERYKHLFGKDVVIKNENGKFQLNIPILNYT